MRLHLAWMAGGLLALNFGAICGVAWIAAYLACEVTTQRLHDVLRRRPATSFDKLLGLIVTLWATGVWMVMAGLYWGTGSAGFRIGAVMILCALIVHAQSFGFRSRLALAIIGGLPAAALIAMIGSAAAAGEFGGLELVTVLLCVVMPLGNMASAWVNLQTSRALETARREAEAATEAKSRFLAAVSHEIRTPMNGVVGVLHLLKAEPISPDGQRLLDEALACSAMLGQLINDVLDLSKVEAGKLELSYEPTDPAAAESGLLELLSPQAGAKGVGLRA